eukprot:TRINITY_DN50877_c0_g1_i1.p1 TRINITY_DN50877_c0_g1~~TRINITY_DN50877_c0_g1_i1.p1  ORF type:complete len:107 (+),score=36.85 TRINITY_DN50877_c0_g1_i1:32-352(+)
MCVVFFFQAEDGIRDLVRSRGLGDVYKRQLYDDGFIVVREEVRNINAELATKLTANELHSGSAAANIQGECFVIVVARTKAAELLYEFSQVSSPHPKAFFLSLIHI